MPDFSTEFEAFLDFETGSVKNALAAADIRDAVKNVNTAPSEGQREAGNYAKGHVVWHGLPVAIENPRGSYRRGVSPDGKPWQTKITHAHYGYFKRTEGKDGDHIDVFLCQDDLGSEIIFIINQVDPKSRRFDEHKVIAGVTNERRAREVYLANYEDGWTGLGEIKAMTLADFKKWLASGDTAKRAAALHGDNRDQGNDNADR